MKPHGKMTSRLTAPEISQMESLPLPQKRLWSPESETQVLPWVSEIRGGHVTICLLFCSVFVMASV